MKKRIRSIHSFQNTSNVKTGLPQSHPARSTPVRQALNCANSALQSITLERIRYALAFLVRNKGNYARIVKRIKEEFSYPFDLSFKTVLTERELSLINLYGLPQSSDGSRPGGLTDTDANQLAAELRSLAESPSDVISPPTVSIIIPVHNQLRFTLACLHSILGTQWRYDYEIILADDASTDQTSDLFGDGFTAVRYLRQTQNRGFLENCNRAAQIARGRYIVFLNNDTVVMHKWLDELIRSFEDNPSAGLVGSKLIYPEGCLQEAGGIVFEDGSARNHGRLQNPSAPDFNYMRDADYCSGAAIAIRSDLWNRLGGFDARYTPAYYEDTDLAFQVRTAGYRVLYQPLSAVIHFEGVSNGKSEQSGIKQYQLINKKKFYSKWAEILKNYGRSDSDHLPADRNVRGKVIMVDALTPTPDRDSGSMDAFNYMKILKELGLHVTFIPVNTSFDEIYTTNLQRIGVRCLYAPWIRSPKEALKKHAPGTDFVFLCRVNTAASFVDIVRQSAPGAKILFDTVDLHFLREEREAALTGSSVLARNAAKTRKLELEIIKKAHAVLFRSLYEMDLIRQLVPEAKIVHLPITREIYGPSDVPFEKRKDVVFIGGYRHPPNRDAVKYFVSEVWPLIRRSGFPGHFIIAGSELPEEIRELAAEDIVVKGYVENLSDLFDPCLITVAPLRYGAGSKGKVIQSLTYGVPCVCTSVATEGCGFAAGKQVLVADDPESMAGAIIQLRQDKALWQKLSQEGLLFCRQNHSLESVKNRIDQIIRELCAS